jgi:hypothetical protein
MIGAVEQELTRKPEPTEGEQKPEDPFSTDPEGTEGTES